MAEAVFHGGVPSGLKIRESKEFRFCRFPGTRAKDASRAPVNIDNLVNRRQSIPGLERGMKTSEAIWRRARGLWSIAAASLLLLCPFAGRCTAQSAVKASAQSPAGSVTPQSKTAGPRHRTRRRTKPTTPPSPSSEAANPPQVNLDNGKLTVDARNSDLSTILQDVAQRSGMSVDGLSRNTRVFGVYGPGSPRDVLSQLLTGAGYNFVMVGGATGDVPRELVLTAQNGNALPVNVSRPGQPQPASNSGENSDSEDNDQQPLGPGAIAHPSPQDTDQTDPETRMQRHLDTLRRMQETFQQNQQQQNQQQQNQEQQPNRPH